MTELEVLKKLGIDNFRQLSKNNVMEFASCLDKMDPEVAMKALEQFPEFSKTMLEISKEYKEFATKALSSNDESVKRTHEGMMSVISSLQKELEKGDLSFEEKKYILEKMEEQTSMMGELDENNKNFILKTLGIVGGGLLALCGTVASIFLSGKTKKDN